MSSGKSVLGLSKSSPKVLFPMPFALSAERLSKVFLISVSEKKIKNYCNILYEDLGAQESKRRELT